MAAQAAHPAKIAPPADYHETGPWIRFGNRVLVGLCASLLVFGLVSISGAVVATGVVNVESNYKAVQHLDGGIVAKILVRNGDRVKEGDVVIRLDETAARANLGIAVARMNDLSTQQARLEAERDRLGAITLPSAVVEAAKSDASLAKIVATQQAQFDARRISRVGEQDVLRKRLDQLASEAAGIATQIKAKKKESKITADELASIKPLYERGFASQARLLPVQRDAARLEGEVGRLESDLSKTQGMISEVQLKVAQSEKDFTQQVVEELRKVQSQLSEIIEQRTSLEDKLRRIEIKAPRTGYIHALAVHTEGGVIQAGSTVMQIIPEGERLIVDAQIQPQDIDKIHKGQSAQIKFPAFNSRFTPKLEAQVIGISAAQVTDQQNNRSYFTAQIALVDGELGKLPSGHPLLPGMPAEVYIETGGRNVLSYFLKPLLDALSRTFRES